MTNVEAIRKFATRVINMDGMEIGPPAILGEISFIPIIKQVTPREERDYLTLSEALEENVCRIIDKGTEVNHIIFHNNSEIPILLEEGEIFLGKGTQDRICVGTVMVQPGDQVEIPVKCVHAPHSLRPGAFFSYAGKCSRGMLSELRAMKYDHAVHGTAVSTISQARVWNNVTKETAKEETVSDYTQYTQAIKVRSEKAKNRSNKLKLPKNTIGMVIVDPEGNIKGLELHRSPHNFEVRKEGILESLEASISWKETGKGPFPKATEKVQKVFKQLSEIKEGKDALNQVEVDGVIINTAGIAGEVLTSKFYSATCPECGTSKPRRRACPHCGFEEEAMDEIAYLSLA